jgi:hypothetical protein
LPQLRKKIACLRYFTDVLGLSMSPQTEAELEQALAKVEEALSTELAARKADL